MLELDPRRKDANLILGMYRYLVSILPRAFRMVAYLVGFDGGKEEALQLIEAAAAYPGETQAEAKIALVVLYNRESEFAAAQRVVSDLKRRYPLNRLLWLESAATWLRDERAVVAEQILLEGFSTLIRDGRERMFGEEEIELGKIADLEGDRSRATQQYEQGRKLCREAKHRKCADTAGNLKEHGYTIN